MKQHAVLSPSSAERWLNCTRSARLEEKFPSSSSSYADEGTLAHTLGELLLREKIGYKWNKKLLKEIEAHEMYNESMHEHAENYALFVIERYEDAKTHTKDALIFLEQRLDLTEYVPEGYGTGDSVIIADNILEIIDLKYGKGVPVSAINNKQLMLYGLGALKSFEHIYDIKTVRVTIYQPRIDNFSSWGIGADELLQWAETELRALAHLAFEGKGEFKTGPHCRFCRAKATCKAFADYNLEIAKYEFADPDTLNDSEIADVLGRVDALTSWVNAIEAYALDQAVNHGKKWAGWKVVEGRSNRKYNDEEAVANALLKAGFAEELIYLKEVKGITAMEKAIGKKAFALHLSDLVIKPAGKPTLAVETDKRPEYKSADSAKADFAEIDI